VGCTILSEMLYNSIRRGFVRTDRFYFYIFEEDNRRYRNRVRWVRLAPDPRGQSYPWNAKRKALEDGLCFRLRTKVRMLFCNLQIGFGGTQDRIDTTALALR